MSVIDEPFVCHTICSFLGPDILWKISSVSQTFNKVTQNIIKKMEIVYSSGLYKSNGRWILPYINVPIDNKIDVIHGSDTIGATNEISLSWHPHMLNTCAPNIFVYKTRLVRFGRHVFQLTLNGTLVPFNLYRLYDTRIGVNKFGYDIFAHQSELYELMRKARLSHKKIMLFLEHYTYRHIHNNPDIQLKTEKFRYADVYNGELWEYDVDFEKLEMNHGICVTHDGDVGSYDYDHTYDSYSIVHTTGRMMTIRSFLEAVDWLMQAFGLLHKITQIYTESKNKRLQIYIEII